MKRFILIVAFLAAAVQAVPVGRDEIVEPKTNGSVLMGHGMTGLSRSKRDCGVADLDKIEAKITAALEKQIELLLNGHLHEGGSRVRRATSEAAAASKVDPDGTIKTVAAAKGSNDSQAPVEEPLLTNGHQLPPADQSRPILPPPSGVRTDDPDWQEATHLPPMGGGSDFVPASNPVAGTGNIVQKVASKANMNNGTSVASAIAKRAVLQTVDTSGAKAIANAEAHKGADANVQSVTATGTHVGIANALVDNNNASANRMHTGPEVVIQNVASTGAKAVSTATNNKGSGSSMQEATATGEEMSIASAVASRAKREVFKITVEDPISEDRVPEYGDDGFYIPGGEEESPNRLRVTRSPCISTKMDDNLRKLIHDTVATAFADLKKELKL